MIWSGASLLAMPFKWLFAIRKPPLPWHGQSGACHRDKFLIATSGLCWSVLGLLRHPVYAHIPLEMSWVHPEPFSDQIVNQRDGNKYR